MKEAAKTATAQKVSDGLIRWVSSRAARSIGSKGLAK